MADTTHVGQGTPQNRLFKQIGTTSSGDPILAEYVAIEPGSIGGGGGGPASSVTIADGTNSALKAAVSAAGRVSVDASGVPVPVTGTFWQATQPVSLSGTINTDVIDRAARLLGHVTIDNASLAVTGTFFQATQPVSGTFWQATQPVSMAVNTPDVIDRAARLLGHVTVDNASLAVTGTFWQATQPVSGSVTVSGSVSVTNFPATQVVSGTVTANQGGAPWSQNLTQVGGVAVAAQVKGTQGSNFIPTQDAKDAGRTAVVLFLDAVAGITTEALATMSITKGGVAQTAATSYTVTAGKTFRISGLHTTVKNTSTVASDSRVRVRQAASGITVASPIILLNEAGSPAAVAQAAGTDDTVMPDGYEIAGGQQIAISHIESATTCTISVVLVGYEY